MSIEENAIKHLSSLLKCVI